MQLTNLELKADAAECLKFFAHTPNLEHCTVDCKGGHLPDLDAWTLVTLPRLLSIHCEESTTPALLRYLTLPALEELSIWLDFGWKEIVEHLVARSACSIRKLDISAYFANDARLRGFLELPGFHSVQDLALRGPDGREGALERLFRKMENRFFLPLLESFAVYGCEFLVPIRSVVAMLCARMKGKVKLKSFQLLFGGDLHESRDGAEVLDNDWVGIHLRNLRDLCSQGLKVDIQSKFEFWNPHLDPSVIEAFRNRD